MEKQLGKALAKEKIAVWEWNYETQTINFTIGFADILRFDATVNELSATRLIAQLKRILFEGQFFTLNTSIRRCRRDREPFTLSFLITFSTTHKKWIKLTAYPHAVDVNPIITGLLQDITITKKLQADDELNRFLTDNTPNLCFLIAKDGQIKYSNLQAQQALVYTKEGLLKSNIIALNVQYTKGIWQQVWERIRTSPAYQEETILQRKDKMILPVRLQGKYLNASTGAYICLYATDISQAKKQKKQLDKLANTLKEYEVIVPNRPQNPANKKITKFFPKIITQTPAYLKILENVQKGAITDTTMLILGATGTGKELIADAIHRLSNRKTNPLIKVNCAALPDNLIESELFGYEKGAFTGAETRKAGRFELANGGTLFLDEIGELPYSVQSKLLRVLEDGTFERIGGIQTIKVNVRIIAATNQNLLTLVERGQFRRDLYYRLNIFPIYNSSLKERKGDIPLLAQHFLKEFARKYQKPKLQLSKTQLATLMQQQYPGNIRELRAIIQRAVILSTPTHFSLADALQQSLTDDQNNDAFLSFADMQRQYILKALEQTNWRVSGERGAAKLLDLNANTLETKMRKLGIRRPR
ncbi:MAG: sigma-54 interaction domain-containing protein [Saprospiraceae bacterium]